MKAIEAAVKVLEKEGVSVTFGVPGAAINPLYAAMKELIKRGSPDGRGLPALINRNPTIAFGSILQVRIVDVKKSVSDYTMSVHNGILRLMGGDNDGDVLALIPLLDEDQAMALKIYDPRLMMISRDGPQVNRAVNLD